MEDLIDIRNRREQKNIVKWYNCNYEEKKNVIGEEGNEIYLPLDTKTDEVIEDAGAVENQSEDDVTSYAEDVLSRINQARDDKVLAAIMEGRES